MSKTVNKTESAKNEFENEAYEKTYDRAIMSIGGIFFAMTLTVAAVAHAGEDFQTIFDTINRYSMPDSTPN